MPPAIEARDKPLMKASRWRAGLSRPVVVRAVAAASVIVGGNVLWALGAWVNVRLAWPVPFDLVPGAAVLVAAGATVALARRRFGAALAGTVVTFALAIGWGAARASWWPALRSALASVTQTTVFAVSAIIGTIALVGGILALVLRWRPIPADDGESRS